MEKTDKVLIADEMLDAAIDEYLNHQRYFAALNLAGVADEIYGKFVRLEGARDSQMENIEIAKAISKFRGTPELPIRNWKKIANAEKNSIKHMDSESDKFVELDIDTQATCMIGDALSNHRKLDREQSKLMRQFIMRPRGIPGGEG